VSIDAEGQLVRSEVRRNRGRERSKPSELVRRQSGDAGHKTVEPSGFEDDDDADADDNPIDKRGDVDPDGDVNADPQITTAGDVEHASLHCDKHSPAHYKTVYKIEDDGKWCQSTCTDPNSPLSKLMEMKIGECDKNKTLGGLGYTTAIHTEEEDVFVKEGRKHKDGTPVKAHGVFHIEGGWTKHDCNMGYTIEKKTDICESECLGESVQGYHFQDEVTDEGGQKLGYCDEKGYKLYVGKKAIQFWKKPGKTKHANFGQDDLPKSEDPKSHGNSFFKVTTP